MSVNELPNSRKKPGGCGAVSSCARPGDLIEPASHPLTLAGRELRTVAGIDPHLPWLIRPQRAHNPLALVELSQHRTGAAGFRIGSCSAQHRDDHCNHNLAPHDVYPFIRIHSEVEDHIRGKHELVLLAAASHTSRVVVRISIE